MLDFDTAKQIFETLYRDVNGYVLSANGRNRLPYHDKSHTYGEIIPEAMYKILQKVEPIAGDVFYDLGSGTGKAVILAALFSDFSKCVGIEMIEDLNDAARGVGQRFIAETKMYGGTFPQLEFVNGDFLTKDFSNADVVFAHSTCFYDEIMLNLVQKLEQTKPGTRVVTVTKTINSPDFYCFHSEEYWLGWGKGTVHFYKRV